MSRIPDATHTAIAEARLRNYHAANTIDPSAIDFGDPVERHAAIAHRMTFATPEGAMSMATSVGGRGEVIDLFAGPGGWDVGARELGIDTLGIEWDDAACKTRKAAGLRTAQRDIALVDPHEFAPARGLIASPPCQAWSMAGKGGGRRDKEHVVRCAGELAAGADTRGEHARHCEDPRSMLVVEPLRWALALEPEWLAFEQVPPVLEMWSMFAQILGLRGYSTWTGVLEAERYGVPQTRERAVLLARRTGAVHPPRATHQRYVKGQPARHDHTMEGEVLPWVSMAEALGWGMTERPSVTVAAKKRETGGRRGLGAGSGGERAIATERQRGAWLTDTGNTRGGTRKEGNSRAVDEPAAVITSRADQLEWRDAPPADVQWVHERPATTVNGDPRIAEPGRHDPAESGSQYGPQTVRVTVEEAAALQTFPPDYPWQGNRGQQFTQVGNAVPPLLARHILSALTGAQTIARQEAA